jgi:hypothetical protein
MTQPLLTVLVIPAIYVGYGAGKRNSFQKMERIKKVAATPWLKADPIIALGVDACSRVSAQKLEGQLR